MNKTNLFPLVDLRINSCNKNVHFCFSTCHDKKKVVDLFTSWPGCFKRVLNFTHTWNSVFLHRRHLKQRLFNQGNFDMYTTVNYQKQAFCKGIFILEENTAKTRRALQFDFDTWILSHCIIITLNVARYVQKERMTQNL